MQRTTGLTQILYATATLCLIMFIYIYIISVLIDQNIRLYDTSRGRFHLRRTVKARDVGWSVLDVCFTPDAQNVLYSSWSDYSKANRRDSLFARHSCRSPRSHLCCLIKI